MPVLSVVMPAFNEAENIVGALEDVLEHVARVVPDCEVIVIDDGSRDNTAALAGQIAAHDARVRVVTQPNQGHGPAVVNGLQMAEGQWYLLLDSDRQVALDDFSRHWGMTAEHDVILGLRWPRHDPNHRKAISVVMRGLLLVLLGVGVRDGGAPYKLLRAGVWQDARLAMRKKCWIPSVLLAASAMKQPGVRVIQLPIEHRARPHGPSTLNLRRLSRFCREGVADILYFRRHMGAPAQRAND